MSGRQLEYKIKIDLIVKTAHVTNARPRYLGNIVRQIVLGQLRGDGKMLVIHAVRQMYVFTVPHTLFRLNQLLVGNENDISCTEKLFFPLDNSTVT